MAGPPHVRAAALHALFSAPAIKQAAVPADDEVLALIWLSRCDPSETNAEVGRGPRAAATAAGVFLNCCMVAHR